MIKIEEYLARRLYDAGVRMMFGIPGGPSIAWIDAFRRAGIRFVLTSHEASAAVMADVTGRLTGVPGLCHATFGPGAVNLASGVGGAFLDRSPLLALTTEMPDAWLGRTTQMNIDHQALFRPLTKATFRMSLSDASDITGESLSVATGEYPGPVHIGLPSDLSGGLVSHAHHTAYARSPGMGCSPRPVAPAALERLIASSRRPLLAAGLTAMRLGAGEALARFLEDHPVPVVVTPMAGGVIAHDHPCYAGVLFHALSDRLRRLTAAADLIIGLGYDPVEYNYESWLPDVPLIHLDTREGDLTVRGAMQYISSPDGWFSLLASLHGSPVMTGLASEVREEIDQELGRHTGRNQPGLNPVEVLQLLREAVPANATVTADVGSHLHLLGQMWDRQQGRLIMTNGWSSMGFGLPAAIGAALTLKESPVVCVTGDGGLMMHAGEIITLRRLGLKITVVVLTDGELNLIRLKQAWKDVSPYGVSLGSGPLFGAGSFLGVDVVRVTGRESLRKALERSVKGQESLIIEAVIDSAAYSDLVVRS